MRLTNTHRQAIVAAALDDVPTVDYREQLRDQAMKIALADLPADLKPIWKKYGTDAMDTREIYLGMPIDHPDMWLRFPGVKGQCEDTKKKIQEMARPLMDLEVAQKDRLKEMESKLKGVLAGISTVKQLKAQLPELAKYAPEEVTKSDNLPALANVMTDLTKLGWPKTQAAA
jgi:hypothetical protein